MVFVVDSSDSDHFHAAKEQLHLLMAEKDLKVISSTIVYLIVCHRYCMGYNYLAFK